MPSSYWIRVKGNKVKLYAFFFQPPDGVGGLIDESFSETEYKVPCLGDLPLFGWIFKSESKSREKSNLYVFLTPHVVETPAEAEEIYSKKKDQIDNIEEDKIKMY